MTIPMKIPMVQPKGPMDASNIRHGCAAPRSGAEGRRGGHRVTWCVWRFGAMLIHVTSDVYKHPCKML